MFLGQLFAINILIIAIYSLNKMTCMLGLTLVTLVVRWGVQASSTAIKRYEFVSSDLPIS